MAASICARSSSIRLWWYGGRPATGAAAGAAGAATLTISQAWAGLDSTTKTAIVVFFVVAIIVAIVVGSLAAAGKLK